MDKEDSQPFRCTECNKPVSHINPGPCDCTKKYRIQVNVHSDRDDDTWSGNAILFDTAEEAEVAAKDLFMRWTQVNYWRVIDEDDKVINSNK